VGLNISKSVLFGIVIITCAIIVALETIQLLIVFHRFPSVFPADFWVPIISSVPIAITAIAAVVALLQLLLILRQAKAREKIDDLIASYTEKRVSNAPDQTIFGGYVARTIRNRLASEARLSSPEIVDYLQSDDDDGRRLAGLCIVQWLASNGRHRQAARYFIQVCRVLKEPLRPFEHYHAILALAGVDAMEKMKKGEKVDEAKGIMFHLNTDQQLKLCEAVNKYKYRNDSSLTSEHWGRFEKLVHEQTWCKKT
jgi:hypothetical protein